MNIKRPLVPGWLKKAEQKLLLNKPGIWSARTHLVLYYGILFILFLAALCFLDNTDLRMDSNSEQWVGFVSIISVIGLTVWLIYLLRFNVFKKFGIIHPLYSLVSFILYFIATGVIVLFTYVPPAVESVRANRAYGDEEVVKDINAINLKVTQLEYELLRTPWNHVSVLVSKDGKGRDPKRSAYYEETDVAVADTVAAVPFGRPVILDSTAFANRLAYTDSVVKVNDSCYLMYETPAYAFIRSGMADATTQTKLLSSFEIYRQVYKSPPPADRSGIRKELAALLRKYHWQEEQEGYYPNVEINQRERPFEKVNKLYQLYNVGENFDNVVQKKYRWSHSHMPEYISVFYYVTLGISLLIFIFRHTTVRTFFLSLLTGLLLTIFTALVMSFSHGNDVAFMGWMIFYFLLFFAGAATVWMHSRRSAVGGILINLFVFLVPVFPLLVVSCYYAWKKDQLYARGISPDFPYLLHHLLFAEVGGSLLLLVLLATYIPKIYRRWYSLPED